jgi:hypothetical protein
VSTTNPKLLYITQSPNPPNTVLHRSHDEIVKLDKKRTDRAVITVNIIMSGISPKQNAFKFKIAPHKQKSIVKNIMAGRLAPLANGVLCISTPKHNGKSGTGDI